MAERGRDRAGGAGPTAAQADRRRRDAGLRRARRWTGPVLLLAGGSNVVLADAGWPEGTVVRLATRGVRHEDGPDGTVREVAAAGEPWDAARGRLRGRRAGRRRVPVGHPGLGRARRRSRTSAPTARRWPRRSPRCASSTARGGACATLAPADCGFAYRSSAFKREPGRLVVLAVALRASTPAALGARVRYARAGRGRSASSSAGGRRSPTCARRCWRCGAARAWSSTPATPTRRSAGSFFTNPVLDAAAFADAARPRRRAARPRRRAARLPGRGRPGEDLGGVADRARGLLAAGTAPATARDLVQAHAGAHEPRWRHRGRRSSPWRARSRPACGTPSASSSWPSR